MHRVEAIQHDRVALVSILLFYGLTITPSYTEMATAYKALQSINRLIYIPSCFKETFKDPLRLVRCCHFSIRKAGWDINEPVDALKPPVLSYVGSAPQKDISITEDPVIEMSFWGADPTYERTGGFRASTGSFISHPALRPVDALKPPVLSYVGSAPQKDISITEDLLL
jgi:hypothetical protein